MTKKPSSTVPFWGRISTLWLMMTPVLCAAYTLMLPIAPNDFWYHVRAGAEISTTGSIPTLALFTSSTPPGALYFYQNWLSEWALFKVLESGGLAWIVVLRSLFWTLSLVLIQWTAWRRLKRVFPLADTTLLSRVAAGSSLLAFLLAASNMDIRPQTFSVPLFCAFVFLIFEWPHFQTRQRNWAIAASGVLMLAWANMHGAFFTGLLLLSIFLIGEWIYRIFSKRFGEEKSARFFGAPLPHKALRAALLALGVCFVATLFNPRGPGLYVYVAMLSQHTANQTFIQEWQAPTWKEWYSVLFFITVAFILFLVALVLMREKRDGAFQTRDEFTNGIFGARFSSWMILAVFSLMAFRDVRSIVWMGLLSAPIFAALAGRVFISNSHSGLENVAVPRAAQIINGALVLVLLLSIVCVLPWNKSALPLPPEYLKHFTANPKGSFPIGFQNEPDFLLENNTPVAAVEWLQANPPQGKIWNDFVFGSYLAWATLYNPRLAPHADPRVEMHSIEFWKEYGRIAAGPKNAGKILAARGFSDALLNIQEQKKLRRELRNDGWKEVFRGGPSVVVRRPK